MWTLDEGRILALAVRSTAIGRMCRTLRPMTADEAAKYPNADRIQGTMNVLEHDEVEAKRTPRDRRNETDG